MEADYVSYRLSKNEPNKEILNTAKYIQGINDQQLTLGGVPELYENDEALMKQAIVMFNAAEYDTAEILYKKILQRDPNNTRALMNMAQTCTALGKYKQSQEYYEKVIEIQPRKDDGNYPVI